MPKEPEKKWVLFLFKQTICSYERVIENYIKFYDYSQNTLWLYINWTLISSKM